MSFPGEGLLYIAFRYYVIHALQLHLSLHQSLCKYFLTSSNYFLNITYINHNTLYSFSSYRKISFRIQNTLGTSSHFYLAWQNTPPISDNYYTQTSTCLQLLLNNAVWYEMRESRPRHVPIRFHHLRLLAVWIKATTKQHKLFAPTPCPISLHNFLYVVFYRSSHGRQILVRLL